MMNVSQPLNATAGQMAATEVNMPEFFLPPAPPEEPAANGKPVATKICLKKKVTQ